MSKKSKRQVSGNNVQTMKESAGGQRNQSTGQAPSHESASGSATVRTFASAGRSPIVMGEYKPDYSIVASDLKRIGILAGSCFAIIIALSFFL